MKEVIKMTNKNENTYNGWKNRETWVIALHFFNGGTELDTTVYSFENWLEFENEDGSEEEYQAYFNGKVYDLSQLIKEEVGFAYEQALELCEIPMWLTDLINLDTVDYYGLAESNIEID